MDKISKFTNDCFKCFVKGSLIAIGISFCIGVISLVISGFDTGQIIQNIRSILLIVGSLGMLLGALLIINRKNRKELVFIEEWKEKYNILSYKAVLIITSCIVVLYGGIIDWIIINF